MPTAPYAEIRASLDGGGVQTGGITATGGQVCQLSANPAGLAGATQYLWEIIDYPPGYSTPAGWTLESDTRLTSTLQTPPPFTLDANAARWGKYILSLTLNGGGPTLTGRETVAQLTAIAALVDDSTALKVLSPNGQPDIGAGETSQFGGRRGWIYDLKATLRIIEVLLGGGGGGALDHGALLGLTDDDHGTGANAYALARRTINALTGASNDAALADARKFITTSHGSACSLRIRLQSALAWSTADELAGANVGAGTLTITAEGGVTLNGAVTVAQNGWWWAKRTAANTWQVSTGGSGGGGDIKSDGSVAFAADQPMGNHKITGLQAGSLSGHAVEYDQFITALAASGRGLNSITTVATANQATLTGLAQTISGVALNTDGMSALLTAQSTASQNGPWIVHSGAWTRPAWFATGNDGAGVLVVVQKGSGTLADTAWLCTTDSGSAVIGANDLAFIEVTEAGVTVADEVTLTKGGLTYAVKALGISNAHLAGSIAWSKLLTAIGNLGFTGLKSLTYNGEVDNGNSSTADTIDWTAGDIQKSTLTGNVTYTFTAPAGVTHLQLRVIQDGTGSRTITWPGSVVGVPPAPASTASAETFYVFFFDGTSYHFSASDQFALIDGTRPFTGGITITQAAKTAGSPNGLKLTGGAHTGLTASTEAPDVDWALNRTVQWATGALTTQRALVARAPTYGFVGASTITNAATMAITGAPVAGTNATITNKWALWVQADNIRADGSIELGGGTVSADTAALVRVPHNKKLISGKSNGGTDTVLLSWGITTADQLVLGDDTNVGTLWLQAKSVGSVSARFGSVNHVSLSASAAIFGGAAAGFAVEFGDTVTVPYIGQQATTVNGATGKKLQLFAQGASVGTTVGGAFDLGPGTGTVGGKGRLCKGDQATQCLAWNDTGLGLYATAPVAQAPRVGQLTAGSGTADGTVDDVGGAFSQTTLNNNFQEMATKINAIELAIHNIGLTA